jgi:hypothetical protein
MELSTDGGLSKQIENLVASQDMKRIIEIFKDIILRSYGVKSADGRRFEKNQQLREEFSQTEAYSQLFMQLATNATAAAAFVNGVVPPVPQTPSSN